MDSTKQTVSALLTAFADALDSMDDRQFDLLIRGEGSLRFASASRNGKNGRKLVVGREIESCANEIAQKLGDADSREAAEDLTASIDQPRRRDFLLLLSKAAGVRVESKDTIARIEQKLIEGTVGTKLRCRAFKEVAF